MDQTITKTIKLKYDIVQTGAKNFIKMIDEMDMSKFDDKTKKYWAKQRSEAKNTISLVENASAESVGAIEDHWLKFLRNSAKGGSDMIGTMSVALSKQMKELVSNAEAAEAAILLIEQKQKGLAVDDNGKARTKDIDKVMNKDAMEIVAKVPTKGKREEGFSGDFRNNEGNKISNATTLLKTRDELLENATEAEQLELKSNVNSEKSVKIMERLLKDANSKLTVEQGLDQIYNASLIQGEKDIVLSAEKVKYDEMELDKAYKMNDQKTAEIAQQKIINGLGKGELLNEDQDDIDRAKEINKVLELTAKEKQKLLKVEEDAKEAKKRATVEEKKNTAEMKKNKDAVKGQEGALKKATKQVLSYGLAFSILRRMYRETIQTITELDEALTEMAIVTSMNRKDTWELVGVMQDLATETGFTTTEIAKLSTVYFRQGRALQDVIQLTTVAAKAARVAGISAQESADYLTSAINGFGLAADQALAVSDKFAALAATSASSYEELAKGLSKFAAQANVAGISIDFAMGMLAKGVETTREAPETIGTALKTVLARLRELTDYGKTLEDGMDVNRVDKALGQMNVSLMDTNGQFRDMESVLTDLGYKWDTLNTNQQASIAVALAGTRQQSRLIAIMQDFDRTMSLVEKSEESAGATTAQHVEYMQSMEAAMVGLQNAWQKFITSITSSDAIITIIKVITQGMEILTAGFESFGLVSEAVILTIVGGILVLKTWSSITKITTAIMNRQIVSLTALKTAHLANGRATAAESVASAISAKTKMVENATTLTLLKSLLLTYYVKLREAIATYAATMANTLHIASLVGVTAGTMAAAKATATFTATLLANPIVLVGALLALLAVGMIAIAIKTDKAQKKIEEFSAEIQAANYDINQSVKKVNELVDSIKDLNKLLFLTPEQQKELTDLQQSLLDVVDNEYLISIDGVVNWDASEDLIQEFLEKQKRDKEENTTELFKKTVNDTWWRRSSNEGKRDRQYEKLTDSVLERKNISDYLIQEYEKIYEDLTAEEENLYRQYIETQVSNDASFLDWQDDGKISTYINGDMEETLAILSKFGDAISKEDPLIDQLKTFSDTWKNASSEDKKFLEDYYSELFYLQENLSEKSVEVLDDLGITSTKQIQEGVELYGDAFESMILERQARIKELLSEEMTIAQATSEAWAELARQTSDAAKKAWLYSEAFIKTTQEMAQALDNLASKMDNVRETQDKWLAGDLTKDELYQFIIGHPGLFDNIDDINKFINGEDITSDYFVQTIAEERIAMGSLNNAKAELESAETKLAWATANGTQEQIDFAEQTHLGAMLNLIIAESSLVRTGALADLTDVQNEYNKVLALSNLYEKLGIQDTEESIAAQEALLEARKNNANEIAKNSRSAIADIRSGFNEKMADSEIGGEFDDYFDIVNGVIVPIYDALADLTPETIKEINLTMGAYQDELDSAYDAFAELRENDLALEKDKLDKQKQMYEDYFDKIDEMEENANNKKSREDIVAQLQRLQGATDEASRKKALDLRKELNSLDETMADDARDAGRDALLATFDDKYAELERKWALAGQIFIDEMAKGGLAAANAFKTALGITGLFGEKVEYSGGGKENRIFKELSNGASDMGTPGAYNASLPGLIDDTTGAGIVEKTWWEKLGWDRAKFDFIDKAVRASTKIGSNPGMSAEEAYNSDNWRRKVEEAITAHYNSEGYSQGGLVDSTGLAMLHGSSSKPEMVLDPAQTQMFMNLRDILSKLSMGTGSSESINIEKIEIKTDKLNGSQDFDAAGKVLANAFSKAIKNRGITANVKR